MDIGLVTWSVFTFLPARAYYMLSTMSFHPLRTDQFMYITMCNYAFYEVVISGLHLAVALSGRIIKNE